MVQLSFRDATVVFATNHHKAEAARQPFLEALNSSVIELAIDSDSLGTFSGDIERPGTMLDALRGKIALARQVTSERFVLASEGSFDTAASSGLIAQNIEMLMLHDAATGVEVVEQYVSWDTNYATAVIASQEELRRFMKGIQCGSHGLVLSPYGTVSDRSLYKGITNSEDAFAAFAACVARSPEGRVMVMSDMRAHYNPTRMKAIGACCELLVKRLATPCPTCQSGGFGIVATIPGLPCQGCGAPTTRAKAETHECVVCKAQVERPRADGVTHANPEECSYCNP